MCNAVQAMTLRIDSVPAFVDSLVFVPVFLENAEGFPATIFFTVQYDPQNLKLIGAIEGGSALMAGKFLDYRDHDGELRMVLGGPNRKFMTDGEVAVMVFVVDAGNLAVGAKGIPEAVISFSDVSVASANAEALPVLTVNGGALIEKTSGLPVGTWPVLLLLAATLLLAGLLRKRKHGVAALLLVALLLTPAALRASLIAGDVDASGVRDEDDLAALAGAYLDGVYNLRADLDMSGTIDAVDYQWLVLLLLGWDLDPDTDGLIDAAEENLGTNPNLADSNASGLTDFEEVLAGNDPTAAPPDYTTDVIINEFVVSNSRGLKDRDNSESDWIEIYNAGSEPVSMLGWSLTDRVNQPRMWWFPDVTIAPDGFLIVFASGKESSPGELHANFSLAKDGEYLALINPAGVATSEWAPEYPPQGRDISYGRYGSGSTFRHFDVPTPGAHNVILGGTYTDFVEGLEIAPPRGLYNTPVTISATVGHPDAEIWYTADGSEPGPGNGTLYTGPFTQSETAALRFRAHAPDAAPSLIESHSYLINLPEDQKALPIVSISADQEESLYEPNGIMAIIGGFYFRLGDALGDDSPFADVEIWTPIGPDDKNNALKRGRPSERLVSAEFLYPDGSTDNAQVDAGMRIHGSDFHRRKKRRDPGADWRVPDEPPYFGMFSPNNKFSFQLRFRRIYGPPKFHHDMFGPEIEKFDAFVLRGGHNDGYNPFIIDEFARRIFGAAGHITSRGKLVNLFLVGEHKGYYNAVERHDDDFFRLRTGSEEEWDVVVQDSDPTSWRARDGDDAAFAEIMAHIAANDLADPTHYAWLDERIDLLNYIDYVTIQLYCGNMDWVGNNWTAARERTPGSKFTFHIWDAEESFRPQFVDFTLLQPVEFFEGEPVEGIDLNQSLNSLDSVMGKLYRALKKNADFRALFSQRAHELLEPGGLLTPPGLLPIYEPLRDKMLQVRPDFYHDIETVWIPQRTQVLQDALAEEGLYDQ